MRVKALITVALIVISEALDAKVYDKVFTKDGSIFYGYMSEQIPGKVIHVQSEYAIISFPLEKLSYVNYHISHEKNSDNIIAKCEELIDFPLTERVSFMYNNTYFEDAYSLYKSDKDLKVFIDEENNYSLQWKDILKTELVENTLSDKSLRHVITLNSSFTIRGAIISQTTDGSLIVLDDDNVKHQIKGSDILYVNLDIDYNSNDVWDKLTFIDRIFLEDKIIEGLIVYRSKTDGLKVIERSTGEIKNILLNEVIKYQKFLNYSVKKEIPNLCDIGLSNSFTDLGYCFILEDIVYPVSAEIDRKIKVTEAMSISFPVYDLKSRSEPSSNGQIIKKCHYFKQDASPIEIVSVNKSESIGSYIELPILPSGLYYMQVSESEGLLLNYF